MDIEHKLERIKTTGKDFFPPLIQERDDGLELQWHFQKLKGNKSRLVILHSLFILLDPFCPHLCPFCTPGAWSQCPTVLISVLWFFGGRRGLAFANRKWWPTIKGWEKAEWWGWLLPLLFPHPPSSHSTIRQLLLQSSKFMYIVLVEVPLPHFAPGFLGMITACCNCP